MTAKVVIGRTEGIVSSVGLVVKGMPFLCRGVNGRGLQWEGVEARQQAMIELRYLVWYLKSAGVVVTGEELLDVATQEDWHE